MIKFTVDRLIASPVIWWIERGDLIARFDRLPSFVQSAVSARYVGHWQLSEPTQQSVAGFAIERIVGSVACWYMWQQGLAILHLLDVTGNAVLPVVQKWEKSTPRWFMRLGWKESERLVESGRL